MQLCITRRRAIVELSKVAALVVAGAAAPAFGKPAEKPPKTNPPIVLNKWSGQILGIDPEQGLSEGDYPFTLDGTASHLGKFTARGEITFVEDGAGLAGDGVAVFTAANGDQLVGSVSWDIDAPDGDGNSDNGRHGFLAAWLRARDVGWAADLIPNLTLPEPEKDSQP